MIVYMPLVLNKLMMGGLSDRRLVNWKYDLEIPGQRLCDITYTSLFGLWHKFLIILFAGQLVWRSDE